LSGGPNDPFEMTRRVRNDPVPLTGRDDVPESLERVLAIALAKQPTQRYPSALEFARALQDVQRRMGLPETRVDVFTDDDDDWGEEDNDSGTRLTSFAVLDPHADPHSESRSGPTPGHVLGPGSAHGGGNTQSGVTWSDPHIHAAPAPAWLAERPQHVIPDHRPRVQQHGTGSAPPREVDFTGAGVPAPPVSHPAAPAPVQKRSRAGLWAVLVGLVLVAAVAAGGFLLSNSGVRATTESDTARPTVRPVDPVGMVVPRPTAAMAVADGGQVVVTWRNPQPQEGDAFLYRVQKVGQEQAHERTEATTVRVPPEPGRTCVEIILVRSNGRDSEPTVACTEG
ncbi:MAG: hypothetical protein Q4G46_03030, partial [Propionibacteriaceae bacterium]|nr:hypothetical protein [Propionibacteriaceae bacterium]